MNQAVYDEFQFYLNTEGKNIGDDEKVKILSLSSKLINSDNYMNLIKNDFEKIVNTPNFNIMTDFCVLIKCIIDLNKCVDFYKKIKVDRMKFLLYPIIYSNLYKNHLDVLNNMNISDFRLLYSNAMDLLLIPVESIEIVKEDFVNCCGRSFKWLSWLENKKKI